MAPEVSNGQSASDMFDEYHISATAECTRNGKP